MELANLEREITTWLIDGGLATTDERALIDGMCDRLDSGGVPIRRVATGYELLHPLLDARGYRWIRAAGTVKEDYGRGQEEEENWQQSPFYYLLNHANEAELRRRLDASYRRGEFELLDRFQDEGGTDYVAFAVGDTSPLRQGPADGLLCSFLADRPGGFAEVEVDLLRRLARVVALAIKAIHGVERASTLLTTYLGADAGRRVLDGAIARGITERVRAVLWYSDIEGFTRLADTAPEDELIAILNDYADVVVSHVHAHGGQVLKFIGDGVLAMFPLARDHDPCGRALDAARGTLAAVEELSASRRVSGQLTAGLHLALHVGDVLYGNIGSRDRLDFTVVGPAVNEVARIEALCRSLEQRVIVSSAFAAASSTARGRLVSLGRYALKGVSRPEELFTLEPGA